MALSRTIRVSTFYLFFLVSNTLYILYSSNNSARIFFFRGEADGSLHMQTTHAPEVNVHYSRRQRRMEHSEATYFARVSSVRSCYFSRTLRGQKRNHSQRSFLELYNNSVFSSVRNLFGMKSPRRAASALSRADDTAHIVWNPQQPQRKELRLSLKITIFV